MIETAGLGRSVTRIESSWSSCSMSRAADQVQLPLEGRKGKGG